MSRKVLLFAPCAFNLAETSRMVEIAKGVRHHPKASQVFDVHFISDGGEFEQLIERHGFPLTRLEPRLTPEKIEHIAKVDRGEKFAPAFTDREMIERVENEIVCLKNLTPVAVVTGSYVTIPVTCRVLQIPLVWVVQSTWLPEFFCHGAGMTDHIRPTPLKAIVDWFILRFINFWIRYGFLNPVNRTAKHFGVAGYESIFEFWTGDITLVAEPPEFTGIKLPSNHYFIGPLVPHEEFPMPQGFTDVPKDKPLIYFAMGSSGTPRIVAKIVESFEGKPYHVIAPVEFQLAKVQGVRVPTNVTVTDWVPALTVNKMADLTVIHGGIGTVMTAALAGKPVVGVGMQMEQVANLAALERLGFAIRVPKSRDPSAKVQDAIQKLIRDESAKAKAAAFAKAISEWDAPRIAAERLFERYANGRAPQPGPDSHPK